MTVRSTPREFRGGAVPSAPLTVSLAQNSAGRDVAENIDTLERLARECPTSDLIAFPEVFAARGSIEDYHASAETITGPAKRNGVAPGSSPIIEWLTALAKRLDAWILAGSIIEKAEDGYFNTSLLFDRAGTLTAAYRKIHLFEARLGNGQTIRERDIYGAGNEPVLANIEGWVCGMAICYDLRFPELFRYYAEHGAHLFLIPSNFTQKTGVDHWEVLLRARAIENQSFVVAPDQCGINPHTGIASYGHSLAVGPWGGALGGAEDEECVFTVKLEPAELARTRERIPALNHRRL